MRDLYLVEESYTSAMQRTVLPYLDLRRCDSDFSSFDGKSIHYVSYLADEPRASVILSHGFTESAEKYHELSYYLLKEGYNVFIPEHRGHGRSYRAVDDLTLTHVDHFSDYVSDLLLFSRRVREIAKEELLLYAHSMGGAIGLLALETAPELFTAAVLSSPMVEPQSGGVPSPIGRGLAALFCLFGRGKHRAFVTEEYPGYDTFEDSSKTSYARFAEYAALRESTPYLQNYGPSYRWIYEALGVKKQIFKKNAPERIKSRLLFLLAGQDTMVKNAPVYDLAKRLTAPHAIACFPHAKHEVYGSRDPVAHPYFERILTFFAETTEVEHIKDSFH